MLSASVDLSRAIPILRVGLCAFLVFDACVIALSMAPRVAPEWFPERLAGLGYADAIQRRVDGASAQYRDGIVGTDERLCVVMGLSGAQEGIDLKQLTAEDNVACKYLGLCGASDGTMVGLSALVAPLFDGELSPDLAIIGISPFQLVERPYKPSIARSDVRNGIDVKLVKLRRSILRFFGVEIDPRYTNEDVWGEMPKMYEGHVSPDVLSKRVDEYGRRGYYDPRKYEKSALQAAELVRLVQQLHSRGAQVVVVLLPLHPALNSKLPANAFDAVVGPLRTTFKDQVPPILDLQNAMGKELFWDASHLNKEGRQQFTTILAQEIRNYLSEKPGP